MRKRVSLNRKSVEPRFEGDGLISAVGREDAVAIDAAGHQRDKTCGARHGEKESEDCFHRCGGPWRGGRSYKESTARVQK